MSSAGGERVRRHRVPGRMSSVDNVGHAKPTYGTITQNRSKEGGIFCMLEAYMDESGIHDEAHACVIAGYWGGENQWRRFERRWTQIIEDADEPEVQEFHSVDFWKPDGSRKGVFAEWSDTKADAFINDLLSCIGDYKLYPMSATLKVAAWEKLTKNERMFLTGGKFNSELNAWITPSSPNQTYYLPFQFAVALPAMACKAHLKVHYAFDLHKQFKTHASELFALLKKDEKLSCRDRLGTFGMEDGKDAPGLQAADLLAYHSYQHNKSRVLTDIPTPLSKMPRILKAAIKNHKSTEDFPFFEEHGLDVALEPLPNHVRNTTLEFPIVYKRDRLTKAKA